MLTISTKKSQSGHQHQSPNFPSCSEVMCLSACRYSRQVILLAHNTEILSFLWGYACVGNSVRTTSILGKAHLFDHLLLSHYVLNNPPCILTAIHSNGPSRNCKTFVLWVALADERGYLNFGRSTLEKPFKTKRKDKIVLSIMWFVEFPDFSEQGHVR